jgi:hypothetical protein
VLVAADLLLGSARGGHEFPIYPGYYPHEITIQSIAPERAFELLGQSRIQAYVGQAIAPRTLPESIGVAESLGSYVVIRVNPASLLARDDAGACSVAWAVAREIALRPEERFRFHPYPVTAFQGDYLYHVDLAEAAKERLLGRPPAAPRQRPKIRADSALAERLVRPDWVTKRADWDAAIEEVDAAALLNGAAVQINGSQGPPWLRAGWFQAVLLLASSVTDPSARERIDSDLRRLKHGDYNTTLDRINLERELVTTLAAGCRTLVAGYTSKREYLSTEYSAGIENIGFDALTGLESPTFLRTAKLKDFPWNGWLVLGIDGAPAAAWNPVAGFDDRFGRLMWSALGDPALMPAPYDAGWMLNRISDVQGLPPR